MQAVLRGVHDVLNLSLRIAPPGASWPELRETVVPLLGGLSQELVGTAWLYLGKEDAPGREARAFPEACPGEQAGTAGCELVPGVVLRELAVRDDTRRDRCFVGLAAPALDDELSDWTWSNGLADMPTLARYLMHLAKVRQQLRVHAGLPDPAGLRRAADEALAAGDGEALGRAHVELVRRVEELKTMHRTFDIALDNAVSALHRAGGVPEGRLFADDMSLVMYYRQRFEDDIVYLSATEESTRRMGESRYRARARTHSPTLGIVTALPEEFAAVRFLLEGEERTYVRGDRAPYFIGTMPSSAAGLPHTVVVTLLGETSGNAAAEGCANLIRSFDSVNCVVMSGIAAGVPRVTEPSAHIRLGDIVVASLGIVDYDHVVDTPARASPRQPHPRPSSLLKRAVDMLRTEERMGHRPWEAHIDAVSRARPEFRRPARGTDVVHVAGEGSATVPHPDPELTGHRPGRPKVHYGLIGSADRALRNARKRDELVAEHDIHAFEIEGTGIAKASFAQGLEWYVVRGICGYADHRDDHLWRDHAALVAAAYVRALLGECPPLDARGGHVLT